MFFDKNNTVSDSLYETLKIIQGVEISYFALERFLFFFWSWKPPRGSGTVDFLRRKIWGNHNFKSPVQISGLDFIFTSGFNIFACTVCRTTNKNRMQCTGLDVLLLDFFVDEVQYWSGSIQRFNTNKTKLRMIPILCKNARWDWSAAGVVWLASGAFWSAECRVWSNGRLFGSLFLFLQKMNGIQADNVIFNIPNSNM